MSEVGEKAVVALVDITPPRATHHSHHGLMELGGYAAKKDMKGDRPHPKGIEGVGAGLEQ